MTESLRDKAIRIASIFDLHQVQRPHYLWADALALANEYLSYHRIDDQDAIDWSWLLSVGFTQDVESFPNGKPRCYLGCLSYEAFYVTEKNVACYAIHYGRTITPLKTRGDVRQFCRLGGLLLKE